ncbi:MAG: NAD(P)H-hydrate dehydratase [Magnetococcales bacterium]|nr:NAD(P)H-hydrate dehydratase [Magnetococcales bacterium]
MSRLLTSAQMRAADHRTIEELGLPGMVLMENAGAAVTSFLQERLPEWRSRSVLVVAGCGNNGGDGFVIARRLHQAKGRVTVALLGNPAMLHGDALTHYQILTRTGCVIEPLGSVEEVSRRLEFLLHHCLLVVDAIFGTGLTRPVGGLAAEAIRRINAHGKPVLAVDLPSGVCADTGRVLGCAIQARWTVTFAAEKRGHRLYPGAGLRGELMVAPIGIPDDYLTIPQHTVALNLPHDLPIPKCPVEAHKGDCGRLLIVAGSSGMEGAAILVAHGAARVGAGLLLVATPASAQPVVTAGIIEAMTVALPGGTQADEALEAITTTRFQPDLIAIGPGLRETPWSRDLLTRLIQGRDLPVILDADALNLLAGQGDKIRHWSSTRRAPLILTPHPGEMARLMKMPIAEVQLDRLSVAMRMAKEWGVWLVLKGAGTVIAAPDGRAWINATGNPGLAAGGSGDLLTGMIAGLLAQGWPVESAVRGGVWLHGAAADASAAEQGMAGLVASDLLPYIRRLRDTMG